MSTYDVLRRAWLRRVLHGEDGCPRGRALSEEGIDKTAQRMEAFLEGHGIEGASVLEIGGGVGELQIELLKRGAARTVNLELSSGYEEEGTRLLEEYGLEERAERRLHDIAANPTDVEPADVVVLHRVEVAPTRAVGVRYGDKAGPRGSLAASPVGEAADASTQIRYASGHSATNAAMPMTTCATPRGKMRASAMMTNPATTSHVARDESTELRRTAAAKKAAPSAVLSAPETSRGMNQGISSSWTA
jgi:hypothetical protein